MGSGAQMAPKGGIFNRGNIPGVCGYVQGKCPLVWGKFSAEVNFSRGNVPGKCLGKFSGVGVHIAMQDSKCL